MSKNSVNLSDWLWAAHDCSDNTLTIGLLAIPQTTIIQLSAEEGKALTKFLTEEFEEEFS